jgi:hypothetical protein
VMPQVRALLPGSPGGGRELAHGSREDFLNHMDRLSASMIPTNYWINHASKLIIDQNFLRACIT